MEKQDTEEKGNVLEFPTQDIAEQLTMLDAVGVNLATYECFL